MSSIPTEIGGDATKATTSVATDNANQINAGTASERMTTVPSNASRVTGSVDSHPFE
jgi:hypothetical protein